MLRKIMGLVLVLSLVLLMGCSKKDSVPTSETILEKMQSEFIGTVYIEGSEWYHDKYVFSDYLNLFMGFYDYNYSYVGTDAIPNWDNIFLIFPTEKLYLRYYDNNINIGYKICSTGSLHYDAHDIMNNFRLGLSELKIYNNKISAFDNFILGTGTYDVNQLNDKSFVISGNGKTFKFSLDADIPDNIVTYSAGNLLNEEGEWERS